MGRLRWRAFTFDNIVNRGFARLRGRCGALRLAYERHGLVTGLE